MTTKTPENAAMTARTWECWAYIEGNDIEISSYNKSEADVWSEQLIFFDLEKAKARGCRVTRVRITEIKDDK